MSFTLKDLDKLNNAIVQGGAVLKVKYTDKEVTYKSVAEMIQARNVIKKELGLVSSSDRRKFAQFSKGL